LKEATVGRGPIPQILIGAMMRQPRRDTSGRDFRGGFTYIDDAVDGLIAALDAPKLNHAVYHLAPLRNYPVSEIAEVVRSLVPGADIEIGPGSEPWGRSSPVRGPMNGARFLADTGFRARFSLREGLASYFAWLNEEFNSRREGS